MSIGFELVHGSIVIVRHKHLYKQVSAYHRGSQIYAKVSGGFARLSKTGSTSHPDIKWLEASINDAILEPEKKAGFLEYEKNDAE